MLSLYFLLTLQENYGIRENFHGSVFEDFKVRKADLLTLCNDLGINVPQSPRIINLIKLVTEIL